MHDRVQRWVLFLLANRVGAFQQSVKEDKAVKRDGKWAGLSFTESRKTINKY